MSARADGTDIVGLCTLTALSNRERKTRSIEATSRAVREVQARVGLETFESVSDWAPAGKNCAVAQWSGPAANNYVR